MKNPQTAALARQIGQSVARLPEGGACAEQPPEYWDTDVSPDPDLAKRICRGCPLVIQCRKIGRLESHGIWGGVDMRPGHRS